jgi:hypothetical protein
MRSLIKLKVREHKLIEETTKVNTEENKHKKSRNIYHVKITFHSMPNTLLLIEPL